MKKLLIIPLLLFALFARAQVVVNSVGQIQSASSSGKAVDVSQVSGAVSSATTITINGVTYDLSANRSWTISTGNTYTNGIGLLLNGYQFNADTTFLRTVANSPSYSFLQDKLNNKLNVTDTTTYRTAANSFTKAQTNTQISNATANFVPLDKVNGWFDLGSAELFAGAAEIGGNKPGAYGAGVYNTSATGNGMFIKGGAAGYHNTDFIDYNNNTVSYVLATSTYTSADHLALTTKDYVDAAVNSAVSGIPAGVTSFNSRTGAVAPQSGDYSSFYPLLSGSYVNPSWIASIPWSKITGAPAQGSPSTANKNMAANNTNADGQVACNTGIATTPINGGYVGVYVNGRLVNVGDGVKTSDAYFSGDGGTTARPLNGVQAGDLLYWNGSISGFQLTTTDSISFLYI